MLKSCDILSQVPPERKDNKKNSAEMLHFCSIDSKGLLATYLLALKANMLCYKLLPAFQSLETINCDKYIRTGL